MILLTTLQSRVIFVTAAVTIVDSGLSRDAGFIYGTESQSVFLGPVGSGLLRITVEFELWDRRHH